MIRRCRLVVLTLAGSLAALGVAPPLQARQATGTVEGKVTVGGSGEALQGASIGVVGTQVGAVSRADGTYRFEHVLPGQYLLRCGLEARRITVGPGPAKPRHFTWPRRGAGA